MPDPLVVVDGLPEGVPPAALRPERPLPRPQAWPFGEDFSRICGTSRMHGGAVFWTDFLYDDHGATGLPVAIPTGGLAPPRGTYTYPDGPAAHNGADIFRAAVGLTATDTWWRVDWTTLLDPSVPIALFTIDVDRANPGVADWPAGAGIRSPGIEQAILLSGAGAWLVDPATDRRVALAEHHVDLAARSFLARLPRSLVDPAGTWIVRLAAGLATSAGSDFAHVPIQHGAWPGQAAVYNVAFRTWQQESPELNFWLDKAQAAALTDGDVSAFALEVNWADLAAARSTPEPLVNGPVNRWYVSSIELGQGVTPTSLTSGKPQFLGRVQPYAIDVPPGYDPAHPVPLTLLLHSLGLGQNQFQAIDPRFVTESADGRNSIVVTPLGRGPAGWYFDEAELDVWEVWARVREAYAIDPDRTVIAGYSMGGYGTYRLGLSYPSVFAKAVVLAGPPTCGVRLLPGLDVPGDLDPQSHCAREGETFRLLGNARWLPFYIAHGALDELVPPLSVYTQVIELDRLGYRYRFELYPLEDHIGYIVQDGFSSAAAHMGTGLRQSDPGQITFAWYPALARRDLGIGPSTLWWVQDLVAAPSATAPGVIAEVDARSLARPDPAVTTERQGSLLLPGDPTPGLVAEQTWRLGPQPARVALIDLRLRGVGSLSLDLLRAGFGPGEAGSVTVMTDNPVVVTLKGLVKGTVVRLDGAKAKPVASVPKGRHTLSFG
jgi:pimeloyl-ACP methyl ester carboxylesterase